MKSNDPEIKDAFKYLDKHNECMNESAIIFIRSLKKYYSSNKILSIKQRAALLEIKNNIANI